MREIKFRAFIKIVCCEGASNEELRNIMIYSDERNKEEVLNFFGDEVYWGFYKGEPVIEIPVEIERYKGGDYPDVDIEIVWKPLGRKTNEAQQYWDEITEYDIMQYTGLKDKNGREIYEGDIVRYKIDNSTFEEFFESDKSLQREGMSVVYYHFGCYVFDIKGVNPNFPYHFPFGSYPQTELEVIGNIHQNPELIENIG